MVILLFQTVELTVPTLSIYLESGLGLLASDLVYLLTSAQLSFVTGISQSPGISLQGILQTIQSIVKPVLGPVLAIVNRAIAAASGVPDLTSTNLQLQGLYDVLSKLY